VRTSTTRYTSEREKFELAVRMIDHGARGSLIERCTGLTQTRIAQLVHDLSAERGQRCHGSRGCLPHRAHVFVRRLRIQSEATLLCAYLQTAGVLREAGDGAFSTADTNGLVLGHRLCDAYASYGQVVASPCISFDRAWYLVEALLKGELELGSCRRCRSRYVRESCQVDNHECPPCKVTAACGATGRGGTKRGIVGAMVEHVTNGC
jgi:hypothetical protein